MTARDSPDWMRYWLDLQAQFEAGYYVFGETTCVELVDYVLDCSFRDVTFPMKSLLRLWLRRVMTTLYNEVFAVFNDATIFQQLASSVPARCLHVRQEFGFDLNYSSELLYEFAQSSLGRLANSSALDSCEREALAEIQTVSPVEFRKALGKRHDTYAYAVSIAIVLIRSRTLVEALMWDMETFLYEFQNVTLVGQNQHLHFFHDINENLEILLWNANIMKLSKLFVPSASGKARYMSIASAMAESKQYTTGGGNHKASQRREKLFEIIGEQTRKANTRKQANEEHSIKPKKSKGRTQNPVDMRGELEVVVEDDVAPSAPGAAGGSKRNYSGASVQDEHSHRHKRPDSDDTGAPAPFLKHQSNAGVKISPYESTSILRFVDAVQIAEAMEDSPRTCQVLYRNFDGPTLESETSEHSRTESPVSSFEGHDGSDVVQATSAIQCRGSPLLESCSTHHEEPRLTVEALLFHDESLAAGGDIFAVNNRELSINSLACIRHSFGSLLPDTDTEEFILETTCPSGWFGFSLSNEHAGISLFVKSISTTTADELSPEILELPAIASDDAEDDDAKYM